MMPTNVTADVTFGDMIPDTDTPAQLLNQYLPGKISNAGNEEKGKNS